MARAETQSRSANGAKKYNFESFDYDVDSMPAALKAGKYDFVVDRAEVKTTKNGDPYINCKMKVEKADDDANDDQEGKSIFEMFIFYKSNDAAGAGINKRRLRQFCEQAEIPVDEIPRKINPDTLEEFAAEMVGKTFTGWVTISVDKDSTEERARVNYQEPSGSGGLSLSGDGGGGEDPARGKKAAPKSKSSRR